MVKVGLNFMGVDRLLGQDFAPILQLAQRADGLGLDLLSVPEHVAIGREAFEEPIYFDAPFPFPRHMAWYDPIAFLAAVAARTRTTLLSMNVMIAPLRPAVLLAKQVATLDVISGGRVALGLGTGWHRAEFAATGATFEGRAELLEEQIHVCRAIWRKAPARFAGKQIAFGDLYCMPLPVQRDTLPIWLGLPPRGRHLDRLARLADGWSWGYVDDPREIRAALAVLRPELERHGRDPGKYEVRAFPVPVRNSGGRVDLKTTFSRAPALVEAGVTIIEPNLYDYCNDAGDIDEMLERLVALKTSFA